MAKEEKLFTVRSKMNDGDYEDVYRVFMDYERGNEKKYALIICGVLCLICVVLLIVLKNITFVFYGIGCLIVGAAYYFVPVNKKFLANNKLQFGELRETTFYPHALTVMEYFENEETGELSEEELESATTRVSTVSVTAYETNRGFLFADGKITNQFFYVAKREQTAETIEALREFAKERCSGGYIEFNTASMIADDEEQTAEEEENTGLTDDIASQFYGARKLHLYDDDGNRIDTEADDEEEDDPQEGHTAVIDEPEMDVDAEWEKIIAEEDADESDE